MSAELIAIKKAIEFAIELNLQKIAVLSDSKSGILALKKHHSDNYLIHDIIKTINNSSIEIVELHYIPGHSGITYNDLADEAAKNAHESGIFIEAKYPLGDAINMIENDLMTKWNEDYKNRIQEKGKDYGRIFSDVRKRPWFSNKQPQLKPLDVKLINRLLTGHSFCKSTLAKMKVFHDDLCEECNVVEDNSHIIFNCTKFSNQRMSYPTILKYGNTVDFFVTEGPASYIEIINFINEIKVNI